MPEQIETLFVYEQEEVYHGQKTGKRVWRAAVKSVPRFIPTGAVLGRGDTKEEAIADWKLRARLDGHVIPELKIEEIKTDA